MVGAGSLDQGFERKALAEDGLVFGRWRHEEAALLVARLRFEKFIDEVLKDLSFSVCTVCSNHAKKMWGWPTFV